MTELNYYELAVETVATLISKKSTFEQKAAAMILIQMLFSETDRKTLLNEINCFNKKR